MTASGRRFARSGAQYAGSAIYKFRFRAHISSAGKTGFINRSYLSRMFDDAQLLHNRLPVKFLRSSRRETLLAIFFRQICPFWGEDPRGDATSHGVECGSNQSNEANIFSIASSTTF